MFKIDRKAFQATKISTFLKKAIFASFPKGLTHDFCHKFEIFSFFVFLQYINLRKVITDVLDR